MEITKRSFGITEGKEVFLFKLSNSNGMTVEITNLGGVIVSIWVPDKNGKLDDVNLGFDTLDKYLKDGPYFGAIVGRHANRIENGEFTLNGKTYKLAKNKGNYHLHGGVKGFDKVVWTPNIVKSKDIEYLELTYLSKDGEENYPGNLNVKVNYSLTEENELRIDYHAVSDKDTIINLTNHAYFNLAGHNSGDVLNHEVMINADKFTVTDGEGIPTGEIREVKGTPMDLNSLKPIREGIFSEYDQIKLANGYDHNWILKVNGKEPEKVAEVFEPNSGRVMECYTTKPGIQFYTGNGLDGCDTGKNGAIYKNYSGFCLETQYFPNAMKHKHFPSPVLKAGEEYNHTTIYKFSVKN